MKRITSAAAAAALAAPLVIGTSVLGATSAQAAACDNVYPAGQSYRVTTLPASVTVRNGAQFQLLIRVSRGNVGCTGNFAALKVKFAGTSQAQTTQPFPLRDAASRPGGGWGARTYTAFRSFNYYGIFRTQQSAPVYTVTVR